jgi:hypothetical protein
MKFTETFLEKNRSVAFRGRNRELMNFVYPNFEPDSPVVDELNTFFRNAILRRQTRSEVILGLEPIVERMFPSIEGRPNEVNAEWIYTSARSLLPGKNISDEDGSVYIIGARRGQDGGFTCTLKIDREIENMPGDDAHLPQTEEGIDEEIAKTLQQQENVEIQERRLERHFYPLVLNWARSNGFERCEITGGMLPGPKWENPDLIEIYAEVGKNTASISIEVACFEVKLKIDPYAVWQAAHYKKFSTYTFIAFALSEREVRDQSRVFELAVSLGLGVLVLEGDAFKIIQHPARNIPDSSEIEIITSRFADRFPDTLRNQIDSERIRLAKILLSGIALGIQT